MAIVRLLSRSGDEIFKWNNLLLGSSVAPKVEATAWVNRHEVDIQRNQRVIVLGLGCGYHILDLRRRYPAIKLLVIEPRDEVVEAAQSVSALDLGGVQIVRPQSSEELLNSAWFAQWRRFRFLLLEFRPAQQGLTELFQDLKDMIIARDPIYFSRLVARDERLRKIFPVLRVDDGRPEELLSVKSLCQLLDKKGALQSAEKCSPESKDAILLVRALRELVA